MSYENGYEIDKMNEYVQFTQRNLDMGKVVTIDGPAASGKTSVSRELARRLGWVWVSTGAFYRGLAYAAMKLKTDINDEKALSELATSQRWQVKMAVAQTEVYFDGQDVTEFIGLEDVGSIASKISHFPLVRKALLNAQRQCRAQSQGLVAEGRDCGTVVFPDAEVKIYLTADQSLRADRRAKEQGSSAAEIAAAQTVRDAQDSNRKVAPLQVPDQALVLDSSHLDLAKVVEAAEKFAREKLK